MSRRTIVVVAGLVVIVVGWYLFRPERLFVNATVNEEFPQGSPEKGKMTSLTLLEGRFHDGAHKTSGLATIH